MAANVDRGGAWLAASMPLSSWRWSHVTTCSTTFCWWYSGCSSSRRSHDLPSSPDGTVTAAQLRARAEAALAEGRYAPALVDGFRALAVRQVERGRLEDLPGATAHEVAAALATAYPEQRVRVDGSALLFDEVLYGDRPATRDQATGVLALDDELAVRR